MGKIFCHHWNHTSGTKQLHVIYIFPWMGSFLPKIENWELRESFSTSLYIDCIQKAGLAEFDIKIQYSRPQFLQDMICNDLLQTELVKEIKWTLIEKEIQCPCHLCNSNLMEFLFYCKSMSGNYIPTQVCTCHIGKTFRLVAQFYSDQPVTIWAQSKWNFSGVVTVNIYEMGHRKARSLKATSDNLHQLVITSGSKSLSQCNPMQEHTHRICYHFMKPSFISHKCCQFRFSLHCDIGWQLYLRGSD